MSSIKEVVAIGIPILCVIIFLKKRARKRRYEKNLEFAEELGLEYDPGGFGRSRHFHGIFIDKPVRIENITEGNSQAYKVILESSAVSDEYVRIEKPLYGDVGVFLSRIGWSFTNKLITFENEEFNSSYVVWASDEQFALGLIDAEVQADLLKLKGGKIIVKDGAITYENRGLPHKYIDHVRLVLQALYNIDTKLHRGQPAKFDEYTEGELIDF